MPGVSYLAQLVLGRRTPEGRLIVGLTGGVASGKSVLAGALVEALGESPGAPMVDRASTDGFLFDNAALAAKGLLERKGIPATYDKAALAAALQGVRSRPTPFPGYSHRIYDIDPALTRVIAPPDILIVEGLGLDAATPLDVLIYLDASEVDQEAWYVTRFLGFWAEGRTDEASFYARFRDMEADAVERLAAMVWTNVNRPNLREHILPVRDAAHIVVTKRADHAIEAITVR